MCGATQLRTPAAPLTTHSLLTAGGPYGFDEEEEGGWTGESGVADDDGWVHYDTSNWCVGVGVGVGGAPVHAQRMHMGGRKAKVCPLG